MYPQTHTNRQLIRHTLSKQLEPSSSPTLSSTLTHETVSVEIVPSPKPVNLPTKKPRTGFPVSLCRLTGHSG